MRLLRIEPPDLSIKFTHASQYALSDQRRKPESGLPYPPTVQEFCTHIDKCGIPWIEGFQRIGDCCLSPFASTLVPVQFGHNSEACELRTSHERRIFPADDVGATDVLKRTSPVPRLRSIVPPLRACPRTDS